MKRLTGFLLFSVFLFVSYVNVANAASSKTPPEGSVQMLDGQIEALLVGNSWVYQDKTGGVYFDPDGNIDAVWKGKKNPGKWYIENKEVCTDVKAWGGEWCYEYYKLDGDIYTWATTQGEWVEVIVKSGNRF